MLVVAVVVFFAPAFFLPMVVVVVWCRYVLYCCCLLFSQSSSQIKPLREMVMFFRGVGVGKALEPVVDEGAKQMYDCISAVYNKVFESFNDFVATNSCFYYNK